MTLRILTTLVLLALAPLALAADIDHAARVDQAEAPLDADARGDDARSIQELMERYFVPGMSIAIIHDFKVAYTRQYGVADVETKAPVTADTLFQAASISKPVAAVATLKAAQDGVFGLDDNINTILTSWRLPENEFTEKQAVTPTLLLSHHAGTTVHGFPGYAVDAPIPTLVQILTGEEPANTDAVLVDIEPGSRLRYSGGGTTLMQLALMDALDMPFADIMRTTVLDPIGMTHSTYEQPLPADRQSQAATGHDNRANAVEGKWHVYPEQAAAGLWTTPTDLATFAIETQLSMRGEANHVLDPIKTGLMITPVEPGNAGLGLFILRDGRYFGHGGSNNGFKCDLIAHMRYGYGVVVMTNGDNGPRVYGALEKRLAKAYGWEAFE